MPKIVVTKKEDAALRKVAPRYLKRTTQRVRWAIQRAISIKPVDDEATGQRRKVG